MRPDWCRIMNEFRMISKITFNFLKNTAFLFYRLSIKKQASMDVI
ncbi:hypothetical protein N898_10260 [Salmonella enterica subsp. arizonae serovar 62:z36:- str. RKS2983]|nr:hypothetical protein N898_10260 [Salmonella enterica subsp. arizonae serovar 62:z36:- str. RKS2983]